MRNIQLFLAAAALLGSSGLEAQTKTPAKTKVYEPAEIGCTKKDGNTECKIVRFSEDSSMIKRAAIGVQVQTTGTKRDTIGVFIARVIPDGPAEKAGIVEGDRIASINGVDLRVPAADVDDSYTAGIAAHRLTREMEKLTPGTRVTLQVNSGGRVREVQVTTARASDLLEHHGAFGMGFPMMPSMQALPNMKILRENMQPMMLRRTPGVPMAPNSFTPKQIRVVPSPQRVPLDFTAAPLKPAKFSRTFSSSI